MHSYVFYLPKPIHWGFPHSDSVITVRLFNIDIHDAVYGVLNDMCQDEPTTFEDLLETAMDCMDYNNPLQFNLEYNQAHVFIQQMLSEAITTLHPFLMEVNQRYRPIAVEQFTVHGFDSYIVQLLVETR